MLYKSITYIALVAILSVIGTTGVAMASTDSESDTQPSESGVQTTQQYNDMQLLSYSIEHINQALQKFIQGDSEKAQEHLTISNEQIATILGRIQASQAE